MRVWTSTAAAASGGRSTTYDIRQVFIRLPDGLLHAIGWAQGEHTLRPFDDIARHRIGGVLARRGAGARPGSETTDRMPGAAGTGDIAAVHGIVRGTMHDAGRDDVGGQVAPDSGGLKVYDAQAEADQW